MKKSIKLISVILIITIVLQILSVFDISSLNSVGAVDNKEIVLVIDPGHGGSMSGATNKKYNLLEKDLTLKVAKYLRDYLNAYDDIKVILTHEGLPSDYEMEIVDRGMVARNNNADMLISLHFNDSTNTAQNGAEVYVTANKSLAKYNAESTKFGKIVLEKICALGIYNRGVKTRLCGDKGEKWMYSDSTIADYYGVIRYPMKGDSEGLGVDIAKGEGIPGILIEHCFMNGNDQKYINTQESLKKFAKADCDAIVEYFGLELKDSTRVKSISLNKTNEIILNGSSLNLIATVKPDTAVNKKVIWTSSNTKVATVDPRGKVTAVGNGTCVITAKTEDKEKTAKASITVKELTVEVDKTEVNLIKGYKSKVNATMSLTLDGKIIEWSTSDSSIATVNKNGIITAVGSGTCMIYAKVEGAKTNATITVNTTELGKNQVVDLKELKEDIGILSKIKPNTKLADLKKMIKVSSDIEIIARNFKGKEITNNELIGTGSILGLKDKTTSNIIQEYTCIFYGDVNGDGKISAMDYALIKNHIMDVQKITDSIQGLVSDVNGDKKISSMDYALIKNHIMDIQKIELK